MKGRKVMNVLTVVGRTEKNRKGKERKGGSVRKREGLRRKK